MKKLKLPYAVVAIVAGLLGHPAVASVITSLPGGTVVPMPAADMRDRDLRRSDRESPGVRRMLPTREDRSSVIPVRMGSLAMAIGAAP